MKTVKSNSRNQKIGKFIAVIGGAGYIGAHMVRLLLKKKIPVVVFDNFSTGHRGAVPAGVPLLKGDLRRAADVRKLFERFSVQAVIHFAASSIVHESVENPLKYYENNVSSCVNLLKVMRAAGVGKFIFSSTAAVYGEPQQVPIREDDPTNPTNPYGQSKLIIERILRDSVKAYGLSAIALRYFNAAGASISAEIGERHDPETHLIPNVLKAASGEKKTLTVFGDDYPTPDGTCIRDYIHVEDLCEAHYLALKKMQQKGVWDVFNLGNGQGYSVKEILETACKITSVKIPYEVTARRPGDPARLIAGADKAKSILGWTPRLGLEEIISTAWAWEKSSKRVRVA